MEKQFLSTMLLLSVWATGLVHAQTVTAAFKNARLDEVIWELQKQSDFTFIYSTHEVDEVQVDELEVKEERVEEVLEKCLEDSDLTYVVHNDVIAIRKTEKKATPRSELQQRKETITGVVTDDQGEPLTGVNVVVKGSPLGAVTDLDGNFSIQVDGGSRPVLVFTFIGFQPREVRVTPGEMLKVVMQEDAAVLEEVIITGYGTFKKSAYAGSASTVRMQNLEEVPAVGFATLMQGNTSGVQINSTSGQPGGTAEITIRGVGSFNASTSPLYVIDNVPVMSGDLSREATVSGTDIMSTINPSDIESITVIKDAAAASLYGSRAANGVVLITTKSGKAGKPVFNFRADWGFSDYATKYRETLSGPDRRDLIYEGLVNNAVYLKEYSHEEALKYADKNIDNYAPIPVTGWANWEDALFRDKAPHQNYEFSVSGGDNKLSYFSSLSYTDQNGISYQSAFKRISGRLNVKYKMNDRLQVGANILYSKIEQDVSTEDVTYSSPYYSSRHKVSASDPVYNEDGSYNTSMLANSNRNPRADVDMNYNKQKADRSFNTLFANYTIIDGLVFNTTFSLDNTNTNYRRWFDPRTSDGSSYNGYLSVINYKYEQIVWKNSLNYVKAIKKHNIDVLIGYETNEYKRERLSGTRTNFPNVNNHELDNGSITTDLQGYTSGWRMLSYLSRANYDYDSKYFLGVSARLDGSSRLDKDSRWGTFWSVSGAWRMTDEGFMDGIRDILSESKIRASFGSNGTLPNDYFGYMDLVGLKYNYNGKPGILETQIGYKDLSWEKNYNLNIGIDLRFINRIGLTLEFYNRTTSDLLMDMPISGTTGFTKLLNNIGKVRNRGFEVELDADVIKNKSFSWRSSLNLSHNKNKIMDLGGQPEIIPSSYLIRRVGYAYNSFYLKEFAYIDTETGIPMYYVNGEDEDSNHREVTSDAAKAKPILAKSADPKLVGGWSNTLRYKWFDLSATFTFTLGGYSYDHAASKLEHGGAEAKHNIQAYYKDRWQKPGDVTNYEIFMVGNPYNMSGINNTRRLHSTDHLRLKNLTFGVTVPKKAVNNIKLDNVRVYFSAVNLFTLAAHKDYDPEVNKNGVMYFDAPKLKTLTFGLDIKF